MRLTIGSKCSSDDEVVRRIEHAVIVFLAELDRVGVVGGCRDIARQFSGSPPTKWE